MWMALKGTERNMERSRVKWRALGHTKKGTWKTLKYTGNYTEGSGAAGLPKTSVPAGNASQAGPEKLLPWAVALERTLFFPFSSGIRSLRKRWD